MWPGHGGSTVISPEETAQLDVREIVPRERHELIFATFDRLAPGQSFVLINDHDPKRLYYQLQAEQTGKVRHANPLVAASSSSPASNHAV